MNKFEKLWKSFFRMLTQMYVIKEMLQSFTHKEAVYVSLDFLLEVSKSRQCFAYHSKVLLFCTLLILYLVNSVVLLILCWSACGVHQRFIFCYEHFLIYIIDSMKRYNRFLGVNLLTKVSYFPNVKFGLIKKNLKKKTDSTCILKTLRLEIHHSSYYSNFLIKMSRRIKYLAVYWNRSILFYISLVFSKLISSTAFSIFFYFIQFLLSEPKIERYHHWMIKNVCECITRNVFVVFIKQTISLWLDKLWTQNT